MKILFINPCLRPDNPRKLFPMGLAYIVTAVRNAGYEFTLYDIDACRPTPAQTESFLRTQRFDVVAFGCLVSNYKWVKEICALIKSCHPGTTIVVGNSVAASIPGLLLAKTQADIAVIGEGDRTMIELLACLRDGDGVEKVAGIAYKQDGRIRRTAERSVIADIDTIPFPDRDLFAIDEYLKASPYNIQEPFPMPPEQVRTININTARGCPFHCTFCYHVFRENKYRVRSPESIIAEIRETADRYGINYIQFWDELTFSTKAQLARFADLMRQETRNLYWIGSTMAGVLTEDDLPLAHRLKQSGCLGLGFSIESGDEGILKSMKKPPNHLQKFSATRRVLQRAELATFTSVVFGYPQETPETITRTVEFCLKEKLAPSAGYLLVQPQTPMYDYARQQGLIPDEEAYLLGMGDRQDLRLNLTSMPDAELTGLVTAGIKRCQMALGIETESPLKTLRNRSRDKI